MEIDSELTFDMMGNISEEEIEKIKDIEDVTEGLEDSLFADEAGEDDTDPEGVGDGNQEVGEDTPPTGSGSNSPNFYASIANTMREEGILTLDDSDFEDIKDGADLAALFVKQKETMLSADQKRIKDALDYEVPVDTIKQYENVISYVNSISEESIKEETPEAEQLRGNLIVQDYLNRGFSQERANREAKKSFDAGTDVEDALEALSECKTHYSSEYNKIIASGKEAKQLKVKEEQEQSKKLEDKFLTVEEPIKGVKLTENERKKVLAQYTKFVDKDETNKPLNAVQKYAKENPIDYQYNLNLLFYLTNGFKDMGNVIKKEVKNQTKSAFANLEKTLRNPSNAVGSGGFNFDNDKSEEAFQGISVDLD